MKTSKSFRAFWFFMLIGFISVYLIMNFAVKLMYIPTSSMEPEVKAGSFVLCNKLAYINGTPQRGDVVVFYSEELHKNL